MIRDYQVVSPSLDGVLTRETLAYDGLERPDGLDRLFDRSPEYELTDLNESSDRRCAIEQYFHDLYGILVKNISQFAIESEPTPDESVRLIAMLQEFVKVKGLLVSGTPRSVPQ
ncbi:hypothetical protein KGQ27_02725 [Patescibacteria group bacterium]|nr:hypothetical protein [Patescibacteria group bacterium]MDE1946782.1 hypothetical protein [Patescibacteria group bacterium]MDE2011086.1 hypothetical protein [Patescibacteria group bacterium]MDE2233143.1 hypothetical protein [Patescibacteria group bacterium]